LLRRCCSLGSRRLFSGHAAALLLSSKALPTFVHTLLAIFAPSLHSWHFLLSHLQVHNPAVCLVVPRLLALSDHHEEAAAALRVMFAASLAAVAARDVFRSMNSLLHQLPTVMFASAASADAELSVISQLRSIICTRKSSCEELGNVRGAVACNSFIILGGVRALLACFESDLCANKVETTREPPYWQMLISGKTASVLF